MSARVHIVHDNAKWMEPLREAFGKAGLEFEELDLTTGAAYDLSIPKQQQGAVWFVRVSPSSHTRGARFSMEAADILIAQLEAAGATVVNGSSALALEMSKARQDALLQKAKISSPRTVAVVGKLQLPSAISSWAYGTPFLLKHSRGGSGTGVRLFRNTESAIAYVASSEFEEPIDGITLIQQYIDSPEECLYRLEFVGGKYMYAVRVDAQAFVRSNGGSWEPEGEPADAFQQAQVSVSNNCPGDVNEGVQGMNSNRGYPLVEQQPKPAKFKVLTNFTHPIIQKLERVLSDARVDICGIEIVMDKHGEAFVIDMNCCNTNYNLKAEEVAGMRGKGCDAIVDFLAQRAFAARGSAYSTGGEDEIANVVLDGLCEPTKVQDFYQLSEKSVSKSASRVATLSSQIIAGSPIDHDKLLREMCEAAEDPLHGKAAWHDVIAWLG